MDYRQHYLAAAEAIADGKESFSCNAIERKDTIGGYNASQLYERVMFQFDPSFPERAFVNCMVDAACEAGVSPADLRILCLCMMVACWKDFV